MQKCQSMMTTAELHGMATTPGRTRPVHWDTAHACRYAPMYCLHNTDVCIVCRMPIPVHQCISFSFIFHIIIDHIQVTTQ